MASIKEIRQWIGYAIARADNAAEESLAEKAHLQKAHDGLTAIIEAGEPLPEPEPEPEPEPDPAPTGTLVRYDDELGTNPRPLVNGDQLNGDVFVALEADVPLEGVAFSVDNDEYALLDPDAPYALADHDESPEGEIRINPFDSRQLANGEHVIAAIIEPGGAKVLARVWIHNEIIVDPEPEPEEPPPPLPEPPEDVVEFILGPQVPAGTHEWEAFDALGAGSAEKWATAFLENRSGGDDYYDLAWALWQLHARTGDPRHLELAIQVALKKWNGLPAGVDWGTNPTPYGKAPRSIPFAGLTLLALTVETPVLTFNDRGTPVDLSLWEWLEGYCERMNGSWLERWDDPDSEGVHSGIRDGGMLLHYLAILSQAHPDQDVRARMLDHAYTAARDYYARVQQQGPYAHGAWLWNVGQSTDSTQPFQVGLLMEGLIAVHQLTADPEVGRAILDGVRAVGRDMVQWTPIQHPAWSHKTMDASYYRVYGGDCDPPIGSGCGNDMDPAWSEHVARNKVRVKRHTNTLLIHAFGYVWRMTGDEQFRVWGHRLMDSIFGDRDFPALDTKGKEYNQVFRTSGRYLGWIS